jgi:hypothetical protein
VLRAAQTLFETVAEQHGTRETDPIPRNLRLRSRDCCVANWYDAEHFAVFIRGKRKSN